MKRLEVLGLNEKKVENVVNELSVLLADFKYSTATFAISTGT